MTLPRVSPPVKAAVPPATCETPAAPPDVTAAGPIDRIPNGGAPVADVPAELRRLSQWVGWRQVTKLDKDGNKKVDKIPVNPATGRNGSHSDPNTWGTFEAALAGARAGRWYGVGFVFSAADPYCGLDWDKVVDPSTGECDPAALAEIEGFASYAERSPSGTGAHVIVRGRPPGSHCKHNKRECYDNKRFFTVTGNRLNAHGVEARQNELNEWYAKTFPAAKGKTAPRPAPGPAAGGATPPDDDTLLARIRASRQAAKFNRLWSGDASDHGGDESRADLALCSMLAFWTGKDAARMDALFRGSGLMRGKWDEGRGDGATYGGNTIAKAIETTQGVYDPARGRSPVGVTFDGRRAEPAADATPGDGPGGDPQHSPAGGGPVAPGPVPGGPDEYLKVWHDLDRQKTDGHRLAGAVLYRTGHAGCITFRARDDDTFRWRGPSWEKASPAAVRAEVTEAMRRVFGEDHAAALEEYARQAAEAGSGGQKEEAKRPTVQPVKLADLANAVNALCSRAQFPRGRYDPPCWLAPGGPPVRELFAAANGLIHLPRYAAGDPAGVIPHTPDFFNLSAAGWDVRPGAAAPAWMAFLRSVWPDDPESIALLREWFAYLLTPDNTRQKLLLMVGQPRGGKGTILAVLKALFGAGYHEMKLAKWGGDGGRFEFAPLVAKLVAAEEELVVDPKKSKTDWVHVGGLLKHLTGSHDGMVPVEPKGVDSATRYVPARIVLTANQVPDIPDPTGVLASRFCVLPFKQKFLGREDRTLVERLRAEAPGIFNWAAAAWPGLQGQAQFTEPTSAAGFRAELLRGTNPAAAFVAERCVGGSDHRVSKNELLNAFRSWWHERRSEHPVPATNKLAADLRAAASHIGEARPWVGGRRVEFFTGVGLRGPAADADDPLPHERAAPSAGTPNYEPPGSAAAGGWTIPTTDEPDYFESNDPLDLFTPEERAALCHTEWDDLLSNLWH